MNILRPLILLLLFACHSALATTVTIIESQSYNSGQQMDLNWQTVATGMGYTATVYPQSTLITNTWFATTDILIVSSGVITITQQAVDTIQSFVSRGGHVFIQAEYLSSYATNGGFQSIVTNLGGNFTWGGTTAGTLAPMNILGSLATTPNATGGSLSYFWYGDVGSTVGCNSHIEPFLQYLGLYYGFIFAMPTGNGRMITTCDQDWVNQYTTTTGAPALMKNILANLATPAYTIGGSTVTVTVPNATTCNGQPVMLTATPSPAGGTYLWSPGGATTQSITVSPTATARYAVTYTYGACIAMDTATVTVGQNSTYSSSMTLCSGASYVWQGRTITAPGTYYDTLANAAGCDSLLSLVVTTGANSTSAVSHTMCSGGSYTFGGQALTAGGTYRDTLTAASGCDSIVTLTLTVKPFSSDTVNATECYGFHYTFHGQILTAAGTYMDTLTGVNGCDSFNVLHLNYNPPVTTPASHSMCSGSTYTFHGRVLTTAGTYYDTVMSTIGCTSYVVLTLSVVSSLTTPDTQTICTGGSYTFHGQALTAAGTYYDSLTSSTGCDSVVILTLQVVPAINTSLSRNICFGSGTPFGGHTYNTAGTYRDTLTTANGCDSIVTLSLSIDSLPIDRDTVAICSGTTYNFHGQSLTMPGTYTDTTMTTTFCKVLDVLTLTLIPVSNTTVSATICSGSTYNFNGAALSAAGTYHETFTNAAGCDSNIALVLTVMSPSTTPVSQSICSGSTYDFHGQMLTTAGTYRDTLASAAGCDSIVVLTLSVVTAIVTPVSASICSGRGYPFYGQNLTQTGSYNDTMASVAGCDSIIQLALTVVPTSLTPISQSICSGSSFTFGTQALTTAGTYYDTLASAAGCDSIVELTLSIIPTSSTNISQNICSNAGYVFNAQTLTTSGTYTATLTGAAGCDSVVNLNLTVIPASASAISQSMCSGMAYTFAGQALTASGTYADTLANAAGCDSIVTLTLTVVPSSATAITQTICSGSAYTFAGQTLATSGTYADTLANAAGCDSIVTLTLTVLSPVTTTLTQVICANSSYTFDGQNINAAGTYTDTLTGAAGCDSIVILNLTIGPLSTAAISQTICGTAGYTFGTQVLTASGTYVDTFTNTTGCDSIVTLSLIVVQPSTDSTNAAICGGRNYLWNGRTLTVPGIYRDTLVNAAGCDSFSILNLVIAPQPVASFLISPAGIVSLGSVVTVTDRSTDADTTLWQLNNQAVAITDGLLPVTDTGTYCVQLIARTSLGCSDTSMECITVYNNSWYMPNAFTPNGDGKNDYISLYGDKEGIKAVGMSVYDRWGEKVFESTDLTFQWDGTYRGVKEEPNIYIYTLDITFTSGTTVHNKGTITLIR